MQLIKKYLIILVLLLIPSLCFAWGIGGIMSGGAPANDPNTPGGSVWDQCPYVQCNGFETQSDDDDWTTVGGAPDFDNTYVMQKLESLELSAAESVSIAVTERAETWISFMMRFNDNNESTENLVLLYNDSTLLGTLLYEHDNNMKIQAEGGTLSSGETVGVSSGTEYIKLRFKQGTGANAQLEFWTCSDGTTWAQNLTSTDGTATAQVNKILFQNTHDNEVMRVDLFNENSADITDATSYAGYACSGTGDSCAGQDDGLYGVGDTADTKWNGGQFVADATGTLCSVTLELKEIGVYIGDITVCIFSDGGVAKPSASLGCASVTKDGDDIPSSTGSVEFTGLDVLVTSGTTYHVVAWSSTVSGDNYVQWAYEDDDCSGDGEETTRSADGITWNTRSGARAFEFTTNKLE